jgi:hypothetical protein
MACCTRKTSTSKCWYGRSECQSVSRILTIPETSRIPVLRALGCRCAMHATIADTAIVIHRSHCRTAFAKSPVPIRLAERVLALGREMGLPAKPHLTPDQLRRIYILANRRTCFPSSSISQIGRRAFRSSLGSSNLASRVFSRDGSPDLIIWSVRTYPGFLQAGEVVC